jgi:hypothetical protein
MFQLSRLDLSASCRAIGTLARKARPVLAAHTRIGRALWGKSLPLVDNWLPSTWKPAWLRLQYLTDQALTAEAAASLASLLIKSALQSLRSSEG